MESIYHIVAIRVNETSWAHVWRLCFLYLGTEYDILAHQAQQVYYLSYPDVSLKNWWVVYKVNPEIHTHRYDEYMERNEDGDVYQEEIEERKNFTVSNGARLTELATRDVELMEEQQGPSKQHLQKSQGPPKKSIQKSE
jgi:hypothetical protein